MAFCWFLLVALALQPSCVRCVTHKDESIEDEAMSLLQRSARVKKLADGGESVNREMAVSARRTGFTARGNPYTLTSFVYGKYFEDCAKRDTQRDRDHSYVTKCLGVDEGRDTDPNTVHVFSPGLLGKGPRPIVVHIHGGGFIGGEAATKVGDLPQLDSYLDNGIIFASVQYRYIGVTYHYEDSGELREEELVEVAEDGTLSLSPTEVMSEYEPLTGWQELMPECIYDASKALDYLLEHADVLEIDAHRIGFYGDSAGGAEISYLSLVYPSLPGHQPYTVVSMALLNTQLNYPFLPMLDAGWALWAEELGEEAPLSTIVTKHNCPHVFGIVDGELPDGGFWCPRQKVCNMSWSEEFAARFCGEHFEAATLGGLFHAFTWPMDTPQHRGLAKLWYIAQNLRELERREGEPPLLVYVRSAQNPARDANSIIHASFWARSFAKVLEALPRETAEYVVYYGDYPGMPASARGERRGEFNYAASIGWSAEHQRQDGRPIGSPSAEEIVLLHCRAMGVSCKL